MDGGMNEFIGMDAFGVGGVVDHCGLSVAGCL